MPFSRASAEVPPWDRYRKLRLVRLDITHHELRTLESGVNYFVVVLEHLGAVPLYFCEGHPFGFYILFEASIRVARRVKTLGFFDVSLERENRWSLRLRAQEIARF